MTILLYLGDSMEDVIRERNSCLGTLCIRKAADASEA